MNKVNSVFYLFWYKNLLLNEIEINFQKFIFYLVDIGGRDVKEVRVRGDMYVQMQSLLQQETERKERI